jgi:type I restriction enzyme S subunit
MSLDLFFDQFDVLVEAPGAVEMLRGLILEAAFQRRLVGQSSSDEPGRLLLERIRSTCLSVESHRRAPVRATGTSRAAHKIPFGLP